MGQSRDIVNALIASLQTYLDDALITFEKFDVNPFDLEARQDIKKGRIALYQMEEVVSQRVDAFRVKTQTEQNYQMLISVVRSYTKDKADRGELLCYDVRDSVIDWSNQTDFSTLTTQGIYTFSYNGSTSLERNERFSHLRLNFISLRNLSINQSS